MIFSGHFGCFTKLALQTCVCVCVHVRTCCQLVVEQQCRLPTQLTVLQAAGLHRERVVVSQQQAADAEIRLRGVSQVGGLVGHAVVHVHFVTLGAACEMLISGLLVTKTCVENIRRRV